MTAPNLEDYIKSQKVRVFDMFALGPFMMWYAMKSGGKIMNNWPRRVLFVSGVMTIVYNWNNYRNIRPILEAKFKELENTSNTVAAKLGIPQGDSVLSRENFLSQGNGSRNGGNGNV